LEARVKKVVDLEKENGEEVHDQTQQLDVGRASDHDSAAGREEQ
jgi:hypothetical protein